MEGALGDITGKMGYGILRYSPNDVVCVIDSVHAGNSACDVIDSPRNCPVVAGVEGAASLGANVFVLGIAPSGGQIPIEWWEKIERAVELGMCIVNGLHNPIAPRFPILREGQWIWDIRKEPPELGVGGGLARELTAKRLLLVGTDMAVGKMTSGLQIFDAAKRAGIETSFVATGQIGITIMGSGVPLDAVRVDFAAGAIEREVMRHSASELIIIEGQGSIIHPASTSTMPLMRGSCPTHLVLCARAGAETLIRVPWVRIPPLRELIKLYEDIGQACGVFVRPKCVAVCLDTSRMSDSESHDAIAKVQEDTGLLCVDPVRQGADAIVPRID